MSNLEFIDSFTGAHAIFQPYKILDHSPTILKIPMISCYKPKPFKFSNILVHNTKFKEQVKEYWNTPISGFFMFKVITKIKLLKKLLCQMLYLEGNIHENVKRLRHGLDTVQCALDLDPTNIDIRKEEAAYLKAFIDALL